MNADESIKALSAPQLGIDARVFCIRFDNGIKTFVNPIIIKKEGATISPETCSSYPGKEILISRPAEITTVYYNDNLKYEDNKLSGAAAALFDQQAQILDGISPAELGLISDVKEDGSLYDLTTDEFKEMAEIYKKFIAVKRAAMEKEIASNEEMSKEYKKLKFTEDVINGRTQVISTEKLQGNRAQRRAAKKDIKKLNKCLSTAK